MECRDSLGYFNQSVFNLWTCSLCYTYLFPNKKMSFNYDRQQPGLSDNFEALVSPDIETPESLSVVCDQLDVYDCDRWKRCCRAARTCCQQQVNTQLLYNNTDDRWCPHTWDGWSCFDDTIAGTAVEKSCPTFIQYGNLEGHAVKECTINGTWAIHIEDGKEWTDYSKCVNIKGKEGVVYAGLLSSSFSLILLIPASIIFLSYRQLRSQQRIQLHVCLLCSFVLFSVLKLVWIVRIYNDRIQNPWQDTFMVRQESICKIVYVLLRYARCTNFAWMFCEGLFLYRLLVHAFNSPKHIKPYLVAAWGLPILPVLIYSMMRGFFANDICWIKNAEGFEWIVYTPNLLCIIVNLLFLLKILEILLTQLHQHPNEPNNYRRALKATFVLVPLFGLQLFLVVYRPNDALIQDIYEIVSTIFTDFQGGAIALIFCYFNGEVIHCIKLSVIKFRTSKRLPSFVTSYSMITQKTDADKNRNQNNSAKIDFVQLGDLSKRNGEVMSVSDTLLDI